MDIFWALTGYLPVLIMAALFYGLFFALPRRIKARVKRMTDKAEAAAPPAAAMPAATPAPPAEASAEMPQRRRTLGAMAGVEEGPSSTAESQTAAPALTAETVTAVLRRQIPPRFDQPARSWLGGLPAMPDQVPWPRSVSSEYPDRGERPLHFLAQICCEDLPADLWGGLGPRTGWLLLFIDPNQGTPDGPDSFKVIHIPELGPERAAPFDLGPVHDGVYTGGSYRHLGKDAAVPNVWRRWPVEIASFENQLHRDGQRSFGAPENLAALLYPGAEIAAESRPRLAVAPLTFGQARAALLALRSQLETMPAPPVPSPKFAALLREEGALDQLRARLERQIEAGQREEAEFSAQIAAGSDDPALAQKRDYTIGRNAANARQLSWLAQCNTAEAVEAYFQEATQALEKWRAAQLKQVDAVTAAIGEHDLETPLASSDWDELVAIFAGRTLSRWVPGYPIEVEGRETISFRENPFSAALTPPPGMSEHIADFALDPARRGQVPAGVLTAHEACWRQLYNNRPHRMGGYHDGVQSDAHEGPPKELLLFQIASDDAMDWCWGDGGAYYFWIRPKHLAAGDFSGVEMWLECH